MVMVPSQDPAQSPAPSHCGLLPRGVPEIGEHCPSAVAPAARAHASHYGAKISNFPNNRFNSNLIVTSSITTNSIRTESRLALVES